MPAPMMPIFMCRSYQPMWLPRPLETSFHCRRYRHSIRASTWKFLEAGCGCSAGEQLRRLEKVPCARRCRLCGLDAGIVEATFAQRGHRCLDACLVPTVAAVHGRELRG